MKYYVIKPVIAKTCQILVKLTPQKLQNWNEFDHYFLMAYFFFNFQSHKSEVPLLVVNSPQSVLAIIY